MKNLRLSPRIAFLVAWLVLSMLSGCRNEGDFSNPEQKVKIGVIGPFSGSDRSWGEKGLHGIQIALDYYHRHGGKIAVEIIREDDENDPSLTLAALQKLVMVDQVAALLVLSGSSSMLALAEQADFFKTPIVSTLSSHPAITDNDWVSQVSFDDNLQGTVSALFVIDELLVDRAAVLWDSEDPHSLALHDQFVASFESAGGAVTSIDLSTAAGDFDEIVAQLEINELEFIYVPTDVSTVVSLLQASAKHNYHPQVMISDGIHALMMLEQPDSLKLLDGALAIDIYSTETRLTAFGKAIDMQFHDTFKAPGTTIAALSSEGVTALIGAFERCNSSLDRTCINSMLRGGHQVVGIMVPFRINSSGKAERPVFINEIRDKKLRFLLKVN